MKQNNTSSSKNALFFHNRIMLIFSMIGICFKVIAGLGFSGFTQRILDTIAREVNYSILSLLLYAFICILFLLFGALLEYYCWTEFRCKALEQYRAHTYRNILSKHSSAFKKERMDTYISSLSNDLMQIIDNYVDMIPYSAEILLSFVGTIVLMTYYNIKLAIVAFLFCLLPLAFSFFRMNEVEKCEETLSDANSHFLSAFSEALRGFQTIKSLKAEVQISDKLSISNTRACKAFGNKEHVEISVAYIASLSGHLSQVAFFFVGMILAQKSTNVSVGIIVMFIQLMHNITQLGISMPEIIAKVKSAQKLMEKNDRLLLVNKVTGDNTPITCNKKIELRDVSYSYDNSYVGLNAINCEIPAYGCYAIIGESGSGKSTFLNLLAGVNCNYVGDIMFDNSDIRNISYSSITELVSVVNQDVFIFDASIKDNLTVFGLFDESLVEQAIKKSGLEDIVKDKGLEYKCGDNGNALSGGEKQRIGIARSIMQGTDVLLMDEITSALDTQTGYQIMETVQNMDDKTRIIVTHDLYPTLLEKFDRIFVLKNGKLVEQGNFIDLMSKKGVCYELVNN